MAALSAAAAPPPPVNPKPFSHRLHAGQLKLACAKCHPGIESSAKAREDNNLPQPAAACRECHKEGSGDVVAVKPQRVSTVTRFNHALHLKLGNPAPVIAAAIKGKTYHTIAPGSPPTAAIQAHLESPAAKTSACLACHRGIASNESVAAAPAPTLFPQMADCLVCHPRIDVPFSCEKCHDPGDHLKPASHAANYVDVHSTGKANLDKPSCVICHGRRFQCLGCH